MIATHNIKVNGQWIHAGEEYEPEGVVAAAPATEEPVPEEAVKAEEPEAEKAEAKPRTSRRKKISE